MSFSTIVDRIRLMAIRDPSLLIVDMYSLSGVPRGRGRPIQSVVFEPETEARWSKMDRKLRYYYRKREVKKRMLSAQNLIPHTIGRPRIQR